MSKRNRKQEEISNPMVMARVPLWRSEWEEFRAACLSMEPPASPYDILAALVRAVNNGDITPVPTERAPGS